MQTFRFNFKAMGCDCEVVIGADGKGGAFSAAQSAVGEITRIEQKYSRYLDSGVVARINALAGQDGAVECDDETIFLLDHADWMHNSSGGLFDITSGVLRHAWDFNTARLPEKKKVEMFLDLIGWDRVERDGSRVRLARKGMQLDLGGIGKEYAADRAAEIIHEKGIRHGYVNMAGDIRVIGVQHDGQPWTIGVRDPVNPEKLFASIPLYGGALATSGDYERCVVVDGRTYSHIINPRTGYPVDFWRSVSVVAPRTLMAGSCSTIAMLKEKDGLGYLEGSGLLYLAVDKSGKIHHKD
ncbi:MAG: FAD:protein FMN transferase [Chlorobiaceae bacterium]|nr:FAD:protein FMN transferase [Chlorobiaceae bacterium]